MNRNPFDDHESNAGDNDPIIPPPVFIPGQRPPSDLPKIPKQPNPKEH